MIWLTWRQFRTQAWVAVAALAALAVALAVTGPNLARLYRTSGIATCDTNCDSLISSFLSQAGSGTNGSLYWLGIGVMLVVPAIIGVFWGAPLVARELETGTHRLAWNQSVTRTRWLAVKLLGVGLASMATVGLFSLAVSWWASPIDKANMNRIFPEVFATRGIAPIGYAAFAFVVGVTAGMLIRRTVPAMAITLVVVAAALIAMPFLVRPHLITPVRFTAPLDTAAVRSIMLSDDDMTVIAQVNQPGAWILSNNTITSTGQLFTGPADPQSCGPLFTRERCVAWLDTLHLRQEVAYQPASRFWALQRYETTIFLAVTVILAGFCFWWVRRRMT